MTNICIEESCRGHLVLKTHGPLDKAKPEDAYYVCNRCSGVFSYEEVEEYWDSR